MEIEVHTTRIGPMFDGRAQEALDRMQHPIEDKVAQEGVDMVQRHLAGVLRVNRGIYEGSIHTERRDGGEIITDRTVYGPWLEGVGSRNTPVTRFPGYHTFRIVGQELDGKAEPLADEAAQPYIEEMR